MHKFAMVTSLLGLAAGSLYAQEFSRFTFEGGAGFTTPVGNTSRQLDNPGWNVRGGAGINFSPYVGAMIQVDYNRFGVNTFTLNNLGFPDGNVGVFSATLDPIVHLNPKGHMDVYLIGGGGLYHQNYTFTQPTVSTFTAFDPFFGFYTAAVPTNLVLASNSVNKPGVNGGAGIAFGHKWHGKFFAEARYDRIFMNRDRHMDYIPVTFGFRY
jgi:hypothetical protein